MFLYISESKLRRKWKSLRDNYVRQKKKLNSENSDSETLEKRYMNLYVHFKRLHSFLQYIPNRNSIEDIPSTVNETLATLEINTTSATPSITQNTNAMQIEVNPAIEYIANVIGKSLVENKEEETDADKLFCSSLLNEIKKVPETRRLKLKVKMYDLILKNQIQVPQPREYEYQPDLNSSNFDFTAPNLPLRRYFSSLYNQQFMANNSENPSTSNDTRSYTSVPSNLEQMTIVQRNGIQQNISNSTSPSFIIDSEASPDSTRYV